jgi:hypothetical protein
MAQGFLPPHSHDLDDSPLEKDGAGTSRPYRPEIQKELDIHR